MISGATAGVGLPYLQNLSGIPIWMIPLDHSPAQLLPYRRTGQAATGIALMRFVSASNAPAGDLVDDFLRQVNIRTSGETWARDINMAGVDPAKAGFFDGWAAWRMSSISLDTPPAVLVVGAHSLAIAIDTDDLGSAHQRPLVIDACRVYSPSWTLNKYAAVNTTVVATSDGKKATVTDPSADTRIAQQIPTTLASGTARSQMATMYQPDIPPADRWCLDAFTWEPTDDELASCPLLTANPIPIRTPEYDLPADPPYPAYQTYGLDDDAGAHLAKTTVITGLPTSRNPAGGTDYYAGMLTAARINIAARTITVAASMSRRLLTPAANAGAEWSDVTTNVTWSDVAASNLTWYDLRLARHPA